MNRSKSIRSFVALWAFITVSCFAGGDLPEGYKILNEQLTFDGESFEVIVSPSDVAEDIYTDFFLRRRGNTDSKYLFTDSSVIYSQSGEALFSFESDEPQHFGYRIDFSYPASEEYSPGIVIGPVYDEGKRVGDTIPFEWNATNEEFERRVFQIP